MRSYSGNVLLCLNIDFTAAGNLCLSICLKSVVDDHLALYVGHRRYPLSTDLPRGSAGPEADIEDSASTEWARGSGMENVMRVFRMESVMLPFPLQDKDDV